MRRPNAAQITLILIMGPSRRYWTSMYIWAAGSLLPLGTRFVSICQDGRFYTTSNLHATHCFIYPEDVETSSCAANPRGMWKTLETMVSPTNAWFSTSIVRSVQQPARSAIKCWFQQCQRSKKQEDWLTSLRSFAQWYSQHQYISCGWIYKYVCTCKPTIDINRQYTHYIYNYIYVWNI